MIKLRPKRKFFASLAVTPYSYQILAVAGGVLTAASPLFTDTALRIVVIIGSILTMAGGGTAIIIQRVLDSKKESADDLAGCLHPLHAILMHGMSDKDSLGIRVTIHLLEGENYIQALKYVGDNRGDRKLPRSFSVHAGVVGKAFRTGKIAHLERDGIPYEEYIAQLVSDYGYTPEKARQLDMEVQSAVAYPIKESPSGKPFAVLYLDSKKPGFFADDRVNRIIRATIEGIALFVTERYT